jgi:AcrR family transcriptional regulator
MARQYHHGDLRNALITTAEAMIESSGIDGLSLRKLADQVGVSRTALYHHFKDKTALLSAVTENQFVQWKAFQYNLFDSNAPIHDQIQSVVRNYLLEATRRPMFYDLMFGAAVWQHGQPDDELKRTAYQAFSDFVSFIENWQNQELINADIPALRLSQVIWGMMHGLARLLIDGIYVDQKQIDEMSSAIATLLTSIPASDNVKELPN